MKKLTITIAAALLGTAVHAQDVYVAGALDYAFPHSGDDQYTGSLIAGMGIGAGPFAIGAEVEAGLQVAGDNDYDTARVRIWTSYDWSDYTFRVAGGVTEYYFSDDTAGGYNAGLGVARDLSSNLSLRGELIRDFMDNTFTAAVTTTRVAVVYTF